MMLDSSSISPLRKESGIQFPCPAAAGHTTAGSQMGNYDKCTRKSKAHHSVSSPGWTETGEEMKEERQLYDICNHEITITPRKN